MKRRSKTTSKTHAIRIPANIYDLIKESANSNQRNLITELSIIVSNYFTFKNIMKPNKQQEFLKLSGFVKDLAPSNYSETVDDELYEDI